MSHNLNSAVAVIGIDIGKNSFHVVGLDDRGAIVLRQKWSRGRIEATPTIFVLSPSASRVPIRPGAKVWLDQSRVVSRIRSGQGERRSPARRIVGAWPTTYGRFNVVILLTSKARGFP
jgi:hypothetical protein